MLEEQKARHRMVVTSFIKNKLEEFEYFLRQILEVCDLAQSNFDAQINPVNKSEKNINFIFNAWANTFQSLKDSLEIAVASDLAWSRFSKIRHFEFIKNSRNAMTHDGMQLIDGYADGKYYIANDIERFDQRGEFRKVVRPNEDIRTLCIQFSNDLMDAIREIVEEFGGQLPQGEGRLKIEDIEKFIRSNSFVPEFAKDMILENKGLIEAALKAQKIDFVADINGQIASIQTICRQV